MKIWMRTLFFIAIILYIPLVAVYGEVAAQEDNPIIFYDDFETYNIDANPNFYVSSSQEITVKEMDEEHGKVLEFFSSAGGSLVIQHEFDEPLSNDYYLMSFDFYTTNVGKLTYIRLLNKYKSEGLARENYFETFAARENGNIGIATNTYGWSFMDKMPYSAATWYHIDMWLDMINGNVYYYVNNKFIGTTSINSNLNQVTGFLLGVEKRANAKVIIDNLSVRKIDYAKKLEIPQESIPNYLYGSVSINIATNNIGNIFTQNENAIFDINIFNRENQEQNVTVCYEAKDEKGSVFWTENKKLTIDAKETLTTKTEVDIKHYGCLVFSVKVISDTETISAEQEFSFIRSPLKKNDKWGVTVHMNENTDIDETVEVMDKCGLGLARWSHNWPNFEKERGVYNIPQRYMDFTQKLKNHGITLTTILGGKTNLYDAYPPVTDEAYTAFENMCTNYVKALNGATHYYEVWNEYNIDQFNSTGEGPEEYAKLLRETYMTVKAADPNAFIIGFVTSGTPIAWLEKAFQTLDGGDYFDAVCVHPYSMKISPEDGDLVSRMNSVKELMKKYGYEDKELWITEIGWPNVETYVTALNQARYNVRTMLLNNAYKLADKIYTYQLRDTGLDTKNKEHNFGLVKSYFKEIPVQYAAKPVYIAMSNYNTMLGVAEFKKVLDVGKNAYAYLYSRGSNKKTVIATGTYSGSSQLNLYLGLESVLLYDMYGNATKLYGVNGCFSFEVNEDCAYIEGDFNDCRVCDPIIEIDQFDIKVPKNTSFDLEVIIHEKLPVNIETTVTDNIVLDSMAQEENKYKLKFSVGNDPKENERVIIKATDGNKCYFYMDIPITYVASVTVCNLNIRPYNTSSLRHLVGEISIKNNCNDRNVSGTLKFNAPVRLTEVIKEIAVKDILPRESKMVKFNIPEQWDDKNNKFKCEFIADNGEIQTLTSRIDFMVATYTENEPVIDGVIEKGEWNVALPIRLSGQEMTDLIQDYGGDSDLSGNAYLMWDNDYLYFACDVTDNIFCQNEGPGDMWRGDGIQIGIACSENAIKGTEIGIARIPSGPIVYSFSSENGYSTSDILKNAQAEITVKGTNVVYETKIPWDYLLPEGVAPKEGNNIRFSMLINDNDGTGRRGWIEYGAGLGRAKTPLSYIKTLLYQYH